MVAQLIGHVILRVQLEEEEDSLLSAIILLHKPEDVYIIKIIGIACMTYLWPLAISLLDMI